MAKELDLITIGRVSVDLYGQQIGSRLEDVATFAKAVGGCPANVAIGAARLGLKAALISRVGNEPMGQFVREQLVREGVDTDGVRVDAERLTSLVLLSVRDPHTFPLLFYRDNCADSALDEHDIDEDFVASARAVLVTGTHFSIPAAARAQRKAMGLKKAHGGKVILDIDYRPNLWGLGGHDAGDHRYARSARVTETLAAVLPDCDLIVGTEEELHIAAGVEDTLQAVRRLLAASNAVIVCKRGAQGCIVFAGRSPDRLEDGLVAAGEDVEVYNVLGAGDAFLAGFLSGYLRDEPHEVSARWGNACGAIAVSRLLCSPEYATLAELNYYLVHGSRQRGLRHDARLSHVHWATTRAAAPPALLLLDLGELAQSGAQRRGALRALIGAAATRAGRAFGVIADEHAETDLREPLWQARALPQSAAGPPGLSSPSLALQLLEWPAGLAVKASCGYPIGAAEERELLRLAAACRAQRRELLLQLAAFGATGDADALPRTLSRIYELGVRPDWWLLPPQSDGAAWAQCAALVSEQDEYCHGMLVVLDGENPAPALTLAAACPAVRGFVAGRTIFAGAAQAWLSGQISDAAAIQDFAARFESLVAAWSAARDARAQRTERSSS